VVAYSNSVNCDDDITHAQADASGAATVVVEDDAVCRWIREGGERDPTATITMTASC